MDQQAATLLATLKRPAVQSEAKLTALNALKSEIKHCRVPENAQANIFECLRLAITQQASSSIAAAGFSTFGHLIKRLKGQDPTGATIAHLAPRLYGAITERLGDLREPIRNSASSSLSEIWPFLGDDVERIIREDALSSVNVRARETAMLWVVRMHQEENMPFKSFVSPIVATLENADGTARETARNTLVDLFKNAPDRAKVDLKRQLKAHSVRHSIESQILAQIGAANIARPPTSHEQDHETASHSTRVAPSADVSAHLADSIHSEAAQPPAPEMIQLDPINVYSERELSDTFRDMLPQFEGKESEHNWLPRDRSITKLRRILQGNAPQEHHHAFMVGIKSMIEGILKVANSLRTTMSTNGCQFVQELARTLGPAMDPHVEILLQAFVKMSSNTKHIASENGKHTADAILQNCSYHVRMMQHIWGAAQEKNSQIRQCTPQWLRTVLKREASYKSRFDSSGGLDLAERSIRKGLDDANPKVKEAMRATYWTFAKTWPEKAESMMNKMDPKSRSMLEKDSNNPNASLFQSSVSNAPSRARTPATVGRSALKEMMAEQRRAQSAGRVPTTTRPTSAMAQLSPTKKHDSASHNRAPSRLRENRVASNASSTSASASTAKGSALMSGPVRRPRKPEIQRPLTADPYASRRMLRPETPSTLTSNSRAAKASINSKSSIPSPTTSTHGFRHESVNKGDSPISVRRSANLGNSVSSPANRPTSKDSSSSHHGDSASKRDNRSPQALRRPQSSIIVRSLNDRPASSSGSLPDVAEQEDSSQSFFATHSRTSSHNLPRDAVSPEPLQSPIKAMIEAAREKLDRPTSSSSGQTTRHTRSDDPFDVDVVPSPRQRSPVKSTAAEVQIYEDAEDGLDERGELEEKQQVLSELPVNENVRMQSPAQSHDSNTSSSQHIHDQTAAGQVPDSPKDKTELQRNRRLLASGIDRIKSRALDAHGFRRVQELTKSTSDMWENGQKFDELMSALLAYLPAFEQDPKLSSLSAIKAVGLKAQAFAVIRALINVHPKMARSWFDHILTTVLLCRAQLIDGAHTHHTTDLERTADDVVRLAPTQPCIDAIQTYLSQTSERAVDADEKAAKAVSGSIAMALSYARALIGNAKTRGRGLEQSHKLVLARIASQYLEHDDAEVRKAGIELACETHALFHDASTNGESQTKNPDFWNNFSGIDQGRMGLLTYYLAREQKSQLQETHS